MLAVVCLLLLNGLVRQIRKGPRRKVVAVELPRSVSVAEHPSTSPRANHQPRRIEAARSSNAATKSKLHRLNRVARPPFTSEQAKRIVSTPPAAAHLDAAAPPEPKTITLEPLGYIEKANGRVEAIISLGGRVHIVHEGEILEDNFKVAKVSSAAVELVDNSTPVEPAHIAVEVAQGAAQAPAYKAGQTDSPPVPEQVSHPAANLQFASGGSQPSVHQELGYVERADGRVEAIVADGEQVRLSQASKSFANQFHGPAASSVNVELANISPPVANPPDSLAHESQPAQTNSFTREADGPVLIASEPESFTVDNPQGIPANEGESESEPLGTLQPEPLADYVGSRFEPRDVAPVPHAGPAGVAPSPAAAGSGQALKSSATPPLPSNAEGPLSAVNSLGYVEKAGGEKEAIVEVLGQVYLVHEGELFAQKYRALQVTSSSVKIVEESTKGSSELAEPKRESEAVPPAVSWGRGPPLLTGSSGTDPPMEVGKAGELAAGEPVSTSRSPPEHPVESCQRPKGVQTTQTGNESVCPVEGLAQTDTRSPPYGLMTVGFVQKASGEEEAIVADEGEVYLVPSGRVCLDNSQIPRLFSSEPQSSRESIQGLLEGMATTNFRLNTPPTQWSPAFAGVTRFDGTAPPSGCSHCLSGGHSHATGNPQWSPAFAGGDTSGTPTLRPNSP